MSSEIHNRFFESSQNGVLAFYQNESLTSRINEENRTKIVLLTKGTAAVSYYHSASYIVSAPAFLFINESQGPMITIKDEINASSIYFHPSVLNDELDYIKLRRQDHETKSSCAIIQEASLMYPIMGIGSYENTPRWLKLSNSNMIRARRLMSYIEHELVNPADRLAFSRSRSYFIELLHLIQELYDELNDNTNLSIDDSSSELFQKVLDYIQINYEERITLEHLSKQFGLNRNLLNKMFHKEVHKTPMQYLIEYRIHMACDFLVKTELPITEIAVRSGFCDLSHFGRTFKKYMNCSPHSFREQNLVACE